MEMNFSEFNIFDSAVISVVFLSTILAFFRGFIKATFSTITWVGTALATYATLPYIQDALGDAAESKVKLGISVLGAFLVYFIILAIVTSQFVSALRDVRGGAIDRTLGFALGFARGILIVAAFYFSLSATFAMLAVGDKKKPGPSWFVDAQTYNLQKVTTETILSYLPKDFPERMVARLDGMKDRVQAMVGSEVKNEKEGDLTDEQKLVLRDVLHALPKDKLDEISAQYKDKSNEAELDRFKAYREILDLYQASVLGGKIDKDKRISEEKIKELDGILNKKPTDKSDTPKEEGDGYKDSSLKEMDRLIGHIE